jgi:2-polyprenyl-3-methyl-5-hydroxy-6-metoxy-1,4-benzoquinol methylase
MKNDYIIGSKAKVDAATFSDEVDFNDHKIKFISDYCRDRTVLDLGCVQHNPRNYKSKFWLHEAIRLVSKSVVGVDIYKEGVDYLNKLEKYDIHCHNAESFDLGQKFDVVVAGDIIEHLEDLKGFFNSIKKHMHHDSILLISTPNPFYFMNIIKSVVNSDVQVNKEHTLWMCPKTLQQLLNRNGLDIDNLKYGSRFYKDRILPFPKRIKHITFHVKASFT